MKWKHLGLLFALGSVHGTWQSDTFSSRIKELKPEGCISTWNENDKQYFQTKRLRNDIHERVDGQKPLGKGGPHRIQMGHDSRFNVLGPWFEGVAALGEDKPSLGEVARAKEKQIAIVGAGMSGLMTYLILHQAGMKNVTILEGNNRLGGRVRTEYLTGGPFDYSYQEMGAMRIPHTRTFSNGTYNITDHQLVFQLAEEMNRINGYDEELKIDFIPWIDESLNGLVYRDGFKLESGLPPTHAQVAANSSIFPEEPMPESVERLQKLLEAEVHGEEFLMEIANNVFKAHDHYIRSGPGKLPGDHWSEFSFLTGHLHAGLGDANAISKGNDCSGYLEKLYEAMAFNGNTTFRTIDGGMSRLPFSFEPLVRNSTRLNAKVERIQWDDKTERLTINWRSNYTDRQIHTETFDYAVVTPPFTVVRRWRLPPLPTTMRNAIDTMDFWSACKVALEYKTRFWERFENPIYGSCSTVTDIGGVGTICYPSYNINGSGPAAVLGLFEPGPPLGVDWTSVSDEQIVQYAVDAMVEIHGEVAREEYTGKYRRLCWTLDEFAAGAGWASPTAGQHELYLPEFFTTHKHMIFVGEHTTYTHAWVASALESGIRGGVQLLLELGLVDEAKEAVNKWMGRWLGE
ncbi:L-amino-acid oxidase [Cladobotryum mycophilum]|uniref:L-amino-acid oxidase n=1 Tax=Cladobotryum mycophilum TaxID=491253 RepID=A0ABR0STA3_9HYPO